ncbi:carbohydrate-binding protein [Methanoculleus sp. 10]|uniref:carbohydrate-binding protein n=1 Tax=Methanoculleus sp. 10 TaxID=430615 RepID=UPI0025D7594A|nr:carbohydrate-binding protein [Methanoculleus sp. 10]
MTPIVLILLCAALAISVAITDHPMPLTLNGGRTPTPTENPSDVQKPYKAHTVPGRINFVDFDYGGEGVAYHDTVAGNQGGYAYRTDDAAVDTGLRDAVDVPVIAHTYPGEWLQYSQVQVAESGTYAATFYTSTTENSKSFSVLVDGEKVATVYAPNTSSWFTFAPTTVQIPLAAGEHTMQIATDTGLADLAYVEFASAAPTPIPIPTPSGECGAAANPTGNPIGGGDGYTDIISRNDPRVKYIVDTRDELLFALQSTRSGDVIYIEGTANIDMSGYFNIRVPAGVTIASNRGENGSAGGRIYQKRLPGDAPWPGEGIFLPSGDWVRFTGLRIEGPDKGDKNTEMRTSIYTRYPMEVDNCEIWGWSGAGISFQVTSSGPELEDGGYIHHNYIHECKGYISGGGANYGYGILVGGGGTTALIEANYLDNCAHEICGGGNAGDGYEARYNVFGPNSNGFHSVDMHEKPDPENPGKLIAGDLIKIHHNTFLATEPYTAYPIAIRGKPRVGAYIDHNWFYYTQSPPVWQIYEVGNVYVTDNLIGEDRAYYKSGPIEYSTWGSSEPLRRS